MNPDKTALERAFELARSGECMDVFAIKKQLRSESYDAEQIFGRHLGDQLRALIKARLNR